MYLLINFITMCTLYTFYYSMLFPILYPLNLLCIYHDCYGSWIIHGFELLEVLISFTTTLDNQKLIAFLFNFQHCFCNIHVLSGLILEPGKAFGTDFFLTKHICDQSAFYSFTQELHEFLRECSVPCSHPSNVLIC